MRVYPAYARTIAKYIARGVRPAAVGVLLSSRWNYFETAPRVCIKPDEWKPGRWEFDYLRNMHAVAIFGDGTESYQFAQLLVELMAAGPKLLWACMAGGEWCFKDDDFMTPHSYAVESLRGRIPGEWNGQRVQVLDPAWKGPTFQGALPARAAYAAARERASRAELKVFERLQEAGGDLVKWHTEQQAQLAFVERLFSDPYAVPVDAAA